MNLFDCTHQVFGNMGAMREQIFSLLMRLRTDDNYHLGIECKENRRVQFSPFLVSHVPQQQQQHQQAAAANKQSLSSLQSGMTYLPLTRGCMMVIRCLKKERDWQVLKMVLSKVPNVLQNKAMLSRYGKHIQEFVLPLIDLTHERPDRKVVFVAKATIVTKQKQNK